MKAENQIVSVSHILCLLLEQLEKKKNPTHKIFGKLARKENPIQKMSKMFSNSKCGIIP